MSKKPLPIFGGLLMLVGLLVLAAGAVLVAAPAESLDLAPVQDLDGSPDADRSETAAGSVSSHSGAGGTAAGQGRSFGNMVPDWAVARFREGADGAGATARLTSRAEPRKRTSRAPVEAPNPTAIRIPAIGVDASMIPLGLRADRSIEVPRDYAQTGWWVDGPEPGEPGPAVVLGHVDSRSGPAVFFDLRNLAVGDEVVIDREDGTSVTYRVDRLEQHPKDEFPTEAVYGPTPDAQLRLVTCGGVFDRGARSYIDNIVVFATMV